MSKLDLIKKSKETEEKKNIIQESPKKILLESNSSPSAISGSIVLKSIPQVVMDKELKAEFGITSKDFQEILKKEYNRVISDVKLSNDKSFIEDSISDLKLIYNQLISRLLVFTCATMRRNMSSITKVIEKNLASDKDFFSSPNKEAKIREEIMQHVPTKDLSAYKEYLDYEKASAFGIYNAVLGEIKAQDFIITKNFLSVQYRLGRFFIFEIPEFLQPINEIIVNHMCTNYIYEKGEKFTASEAIKSFEEEGLRIEMVHGSIRDDGCSTMFIRKNVHGFTKIKNSSYFTDLFSETNMTAEEKDNAIKNMIKIAQGEKIYLSELKLGGKRKPHESQHEMSFFVVGKTGSGKTTLFRQLVVGDTPEQNRITIEDTAELFLPNSISYVTTKEYGIGDIFTSTLRQNPTSVYIGETRTGDVLLQILETSLTAHSGSTFHAGDMDKCLARFDLMVGSGDSQVNIDVLHRLLCSTIGMFVFMADRKIIELWFRNEKQYNGDFFECYDNVVY